MYMGSQLVVIEFHRPVVCLQIVTSVRMFNVTSLVYTLERDRGQTTVVRGHLKQHKSTAGTKYHNKENIRRSCLYVCST